MLPVYSIRIILIMMLAGTHTFAMLHRTKEMHPRPSHRNQLVYSVVHRVLPSCFEYLTRFEDNLVAYFVDVLVHDFQLRLILQLYTVQCMSHGSSRVGGKGMIVILTGLSWHDHQAFHLGIGNRYMSPSPTKNETRGQIRANRDNRKYHNAMQPTQPTKSKLEAREVGTNGFVYNHVIYQVEESQRKSN